MSQIGFGESANPDMPPHADPTATSDPHRPWTSAVHESHNLGADVINVATAPDLASQNWGNPDLDNSSRATRELLQELSVCNQKCHQAYTLLQQAQEQLRLSQLVIQRQETLIANLQERIAQQDSVIKESQSSCDDLRDRLKRQQHHTSQLKAALERCLENDAKGGSAPNTASSWGITKLAEERIIPVATEPSNTAPVDQIPAPILTPIATPTNATEITAEILLTGDHESGQSVITENISPSLIQPLPNSLTIQTIETPAVAVKNPFPPKLTDHKISENLLRNGVPELPRWQNSLQNNSDIATAPNPSHTPNHSWSSMVLTEEKSSAQPASEPELIPQMSAYPVSLAMPQVNPPKFLQHLGEIMPKEDTKTNDDHGGSSLGSGLTKGLVTKRTTMAAVQLPQFPPIRRR